jgi:DNA-binding CsgD family transcriptional regulator
MNISNITKLISQLLSASEEVYTKDIDAIRFAKDSYIDEFSYSENSVRAIFDHVNNKIIHISDNAESLGGYPVEKFYNLGLSFLFQVFTLEHYDFPYRWWKWSYETHLKYGISAKSKQAMCGVKFIHKDGRIVRVLLRQVGIKWDEKGIITVSAFTLDDVSHLIKADFYWGRIETPKEEKQFFHLISTEKKDKLSDILTDREKEMVRLLAQGKESKEIGKLLFVSPHTVDNHRRNMIAKIGVKDTTGLVQICRMVGII